MRPPGKGTAPVILVFGLLAVWPVTAVRHAGPVRGSAHALAGDTLVVAGDRHRLYGIIAPELTQTCRTHDGRDWPCGRESAAALEGLIAGRPVSCTVRDCDSSGRLVSICRADGADLGGWMVRNGWAIADPQVPGSYTGAEASARFLRFGLWADDFDQPTMRRLSHP